jgi:hypothetical protein
VGIGEGSGDSAVIIHAWRWADSVTILVGPDVQVHCGRFDTKGSKEPPVVYGDKLDEHELGSVGGLIALDRRLAQVLVRVLVFMREDGDFRGHAVFHCIEFRFRFSFFGLRAGGLLCVPAVCFDLFLRSHPDCRVQAGSGENGVAKSEMLEKMENIDFPGRGITSRKKLSNCIATILLPDVYIKLFHTRGKSRSSKRDQENSIHRARCNSSSGASRFELRWNRG